MAHARCISKLISLVGLLFLSYTAAFAAKPKRACPADFQAAVNPFKVDLTGDFDPREAWRQGGLDPDKIRVRVGFVDSNSSKGTEASYSFRVEYEGQMIGQMNIWRTNPYIWQTDNSYFHPDYRGRGLGSLMYLIASAKVFTEKSRGKIRTIGHSGEANRMWQNLHAKKFAQGIEWAGEIPTALEMKRSSFGSRLMQYARELPIEKRDLNE